MAITVVGIGNLQSGTGAGLSLATPASRQANDIDIGIVQTANEAATLFSGSEEGYAAITGGNSGTGTAGSGTSVYLFWRRWNGTDGTGLIEDSGDHQFAHVITLRGVKTTGDPWEVINTNTQTATTSGSISGVTTTTDGAMVLSIISGDTGASESFSEFSGWTNGDLASITEGFDYRGNLGNGGSFGLAYGIDTTAGSVGATTVTCATSAAHANLMIAFTPEGAVSGTSIEAELEAGAEISASTVDHEVFQNTDLISGFTIDGQVTANSGGSTENIEADLLAGHSVEDGDTLDIYIAGYSDLTAGFTLDLTESSVTAENIEAELTTSTTLDEDGLQKIVGGLEAELTTGFNLETSSLVQSISATINAGFSLTGSSNLGKVVEDLIREGSDFVDNPKEYVRDSNRDIVKRY